MSFRLVALIPHHLPRLISFTAANRVDHEAFYNQAAWAPGEQAASGARRAISQGYAQIAGPQRRLRGGPAGYIGAPSSGGAIGEEADAMDTTLRAIHRIRARQVAKVKTMADGMSDTLSGALCCSAVTWPSTGW